MIDLRKYIGCKTQIGENVQIWIWTLWYMQLGDGAFQVYEAVHIKFEGEVGSIFYTGPLSLDVKVLDERNMEAIINGQKAVETIYKVEGDVLKIDLALGDGTKVQLTCQRTSETHTHLNINGLNVNLDKGPHR